MVYPHSVLALYTYIVYSIKYEKKDRKETIKSKLTHPYMG